MAINKLLGVQEIINLINVFFLWHSLIVNIGHEAFAQLFDVIDSNIDVDVLLSVLHKVILR